MRSLVLKLTLAFLFVGLIGALLVAVFVGLRTQREFNQFISDRNQQELVDKLANFYQEHGSWEGLSAINLRLDDGQGQPAFVRAPVALIDNDRTVVLGSRNFQVGQQIGKADIRVSLPVEVDGQVVGAVLFDLPGDVPRRDPRSPEVAFIAKVNRAIVFGALGAAVIALVLGVLLARAISQPIGELTEATQRVASGELGLQVPVRTQDEIGELAVSFNRMSADLATSNHLRRQMTADIAHELRTPLSIILGYTEALSDGKLHGKPAIYDAMYGEARLLSHLVDDLRTLSLADAGELALNRVMLAPAESLERVAAANAELAAQRGIRLEVQIAPDLPWVEADRERLAQVLANLVSNALRYTPDGGVITLSGEAVDHRVLLRVSDTGQGIDPEHTPHVFRRFYRADPSRPDTGESGLGLAIAKSLVEAQGGTIEVQSVLGQGTTFTVALPAARGEASHDA
ncbi:MAG TPA: ATP-binding protein [Anaerolineae bacterium]|nr:ATP-binding protein [Anaerolineae bacterium]HNU03502.1 ATP-binding protein [Anaerolineae bacterium]